MHPNSRHAAQLPSGPVARVVGRPNWTRVCVKCKNLRRRFAGRHWYCYAENRAGEILSCAEARGPAGVCFGGKAFIQANPTGQTRHTDGGK